MIRFRLTIFTLFILTNSFGQKIEKIFLDKKDTTKNHYTIIYPANPPYTGYIFIIPGFGETAERVLQQTDLPKITAQNGLLTIIPTFQDGVLSFGVDSLSQQSFNTILQDVKSKHTFIDQRFYLGGYSIGGSTVIKYAENVKIKPTAVFAIDPPLDFERFYYSSKRDVRLSVNTKPSEGSLYMIDRIEKEMNGTPQKALSNYYKISPYSFSDITQNEIKKLGNTPLRIYSEPDVNWWLTEYKADFTSMNVTECSAMINELNRLGNTNAELIITQNKGYRKPDNIKNPHSWSIVDNNELVEWLLKQK